MAVQIDGTLGINAIQPVALTDKLGRRNYLINGNFDKWDYGTSQTSNGYGSDNRWCIGNASSSSTHTQMVCGDTERAFFNAMYYSRTVVSSAAGASNYATKQQLIENINLLAGKTVTLSFWAKADSNKNIAVEFTQMFGTGGNPSPYNTGIGSQLVALTTSWKKYTITVTIPSIVGKTLGTDGVQTTFTKVLFWFDAGANSAARSANLGQQSGTFDIAQVKLEDGSVATNGWHPYDGEFGGEVEACERYVNIIRNLNLDFGSYTGTTYISYPLWHTTMRVIPSATLNLPNILYSNSSGVAVTPKSPSITKIAFNSTASVPDAYFAFGAGDYIMLSAEL
jgi:hypothetical protein